MEREIEAQAGQVSDVNEFLKLVDKYLDIPELDATILNELVSRIVVHSPVRENGRKQVRIDPVFHLCGANPHSFEDWKGVLKRIRNRRDLTRRFLPKFFFYFLMGRCLTATDPFWYAFQDTLLSLGAGLAAFFRPRDGAAFWAVFRLPAPVWAFPCPARISR